MMFETKFLTFVGVLLFLMIQGGSLSGPTRTELLLEGKFVNSLQWNVEGERALIGARSGGDVFLMEYNAMANELEALPYSSGNNRLQYWDQAGDILFSESTVDPFLATGNTRFIQLRRATGQTQELYATDLVLHFQWNLRHNELLFVATPHGDEAYLSLWDAANNNTTLLFTPPEGATVKEAVMNDRGNKILFVVKTLGADSFYSLWMLDLENGERAEIIKEQPDTIRSLNWSPDGRWFAYLRMRPREYGNFMLEFQELEGAGRYQLTPADLGFSPAGIAWSPQPERMLAHSVGTPLGQELYLLRLDELCPDAPFLQ